MEIKSGGSSERVSPWYIDNDVVVFLPGYADLSSLEISAVHANGLSIDGILAEAGVDYSGIELNVPHELSYQTYSRTEKQRLIFMQSGNIPTMYIDTESANMDNIHAQKGNAEKGNIRLYRDDGELAYTGSLNSIAGRGNTTWDSADKKAYTIELAQEADLLSMGTADDWVLLANAFDASNMRNRIVYDFAIRVGLAYSPESQWVDLYLNGVYAGLYLLAEQNEVHEQRVAIEGENSFLVSMERRGRMVSQNLPHIVTEAGQTLRIRYPKQATVEQEDALLATWQRIENAILDEAGLDRETGAHWRDLIDMDSWVRKYLIEEIFGNLDACVISQFFYMDASADSKRVFAGPVWDYDLSMGNTWHTSSLDFMCANRLHVNGDTDTPWFHKLYQKEEFYQRIVDIFRDEFLPMLYELRDGGIEQYAEQVFKAAEMNGIRWNHADFAEEVELIQSYMTRRIDFLEKIWIDNLPYHTVEARSAGVSYAYFAVIDGESIGKLPVLESSSKSTFEGWYYENGEPFDYDRAIQEDVRIAARWSGVNSAYMFYVQYIVPAAVLAVLFFIFFTVECRKIIKGGKKSCLRKNKNTGMN